MSVRRGLWRNITGLASVLLLMELTIRFQSIASLAAIARQQRGAPQRLIPEYTEAVTVKRDTVVTTDMPKIPVDDKCTLTPATGRGEEA